MYIDLSIIILFVLICLYFVVMFFYHKILLTREKKISFTCKKALEEAKDMLKDYQKEIEKSAFNIDILNDKIEEFENENKFIRSKSKHLKAQNEDLKNKLRRSDVDY